MVIVGARDMQVVVSADQNSFARTTRTHRSGGFALQPGVPLAAGRSWDPDPRPAPLATRHLTVKSNGARALCREPLRCQHSATRSVEVSACQGSVRSGGRLPRPGTRFAARRASLGRWHGFIQSGGARAGFRDPLRCHTPASRSFEVSAFESSVTDRPTLA